MGGAGLIFPKNFGMEILVPPAGAPKRGDGLGKHPVGAEFGGSTHLPASKAIPCGYGGRNRGLGEIPVSSMSSRPQCQGDGLTALLDAGD